MGVGCAMPQLLRAVQGATGSKGGTGEQGVVRRGVVWPGVLKTESRAFVPLSLDDFFEAPPPGGRGARRCSPAKADQRLRRPHTSDDMHVASDSRWHEEELQRDQGKRSVLFYAYDLADGFADHF